jgi:Tol biopolymer transport system component
MQQVSLSSDGRYLAYDGPSYVWLRDLVAGTTERLSNEVDGDSNPSTNLWSPQAMTPDASSIVYSAIHGADHVSTTNPETVYITKRN